MAEFKTLPIRLSEQSDALLRSHFRAKGDMSTQLDEILRSVDLRKIALVHFPVGRAASEDQSQRPVFRTSVRIDIAMHARLQNVAERRHVSVNELLNSAIQASQPDAL